ncbi:MAG: oligosaccharide flippase family protein [Desulfovibrionaceae bacterium]
MSRNSHLSAISVQVISNGAVAALSFGIVVLLARVMGPVAFGRYNFLLSVAALFMILQDGGFRNLIYRELIRPTYSRESADQILPLGLGHLSVVTLAGVAVCLVLPVSGDLRAGLAASCFCFGCVACANYISALYQSRGLFGKDARWQLALRVVSGLCIASTLLFLSVRPWVVFLAWSIGTCLCLLAVGGEFRAPRFQAFTRTPFASACLSFMFINASTALYHRVDIIMLELLQGGEGVGQYAAAYRFLDGFILLATPVGVVLFHKLRRIGRDRALFRREVARYGAVLMGVGAGLFFGAVLLGEAVASLVYGARYAATAGLLPVLFLALVFNLPNGVLTQAVVADNREGAYAKAAFACALVNGGLNLVFIPAWGPMGAALATVATEAVLTALLLYILVGK